MTRIPDDHPRAASLRLRERMLHGVRQGLAAEAGLLAHGRGEAFYYLLGERTHPFAREAVAAASALILTARHPVFSVNGNVAALAGEELGQLARAVPEVSFEVNLFHRSDERVRIILEHLRRCGVERPLAAGIDPSVELPGLSSERRKMATAGIAAADVVLVPLEDGDRCGALCASGRKVITVDLNPLSRTARTAQVTIVDELTSVLPQLIDRIARDRSIGAAELEARWRGYDNARVLADAVAVIRNGAG